MKTILSEKIHRIVKNKTRLEKILNIKITNNGKEVTIDGEAQDEYEATKVIDALNFGFPFSAAISIKNEGKILEFVNIKEYSQKRNLESVRARIIGKGGRTLATLSQLTKGDFELKDNQVGIIVEPEHMQNAITAVIQLIQGSKQANIYKGLEKNQPEYEYDLGLKDEDLNKNL